MSREGECKGILEGVVIEKGRAGAGWSEDQRQGIPVYHHFFTAGLASQFCIDADGIDATIDLKVHGRRYLDDNVTPRGRKTESEESKM